MTGPDPRDTLPEVAHIQPGTGRSAVLTFTDGTRAFFCPEYTPRACLTAARDGWALLLADWGNGNAPVYRVPAHLRAPLCAALGLRPGSKSSRAE